MKYRFLCFLCFLFTAFVYSQNLHIFKYSGKYGYVDDSLKVVIKPVYDQAYNFGDDGYAIVHEENTGYSLINIKGQKDKKLSNCMRIEKIFDNVYYNNWDNYIYNVKTKEFYAFQAPMIAKECKVDFLCPVNCYDENSNKRFYFLDKTGKTTEIKGNWAKCYPMVDGAAVVLDKNYNISLLNSDGNVIKAGIQNSGVNYSEGLLAVKTKTDKGFVDVNGNLVFACELYEDEYEEYVPSLNYYYSEGVVVIQTARNCFQILDKSGNILMNKRKLSCCGNMSCGNILYQETEDSPFGFINQYGNFTISPCFDNAESFSNNYAVVVYKGQDAIVDVNGNLYFSADLISGKRKFSLQLPHTGI